ncbi:MAG: hypothetical protein ACKO0M_03455 [Cyanobium sp.]
MDDLDAFCRWNCGPLMEHRTRGAYAEWLVHRALALDPGEFRGEEARLTLAGGELSLEVKSSAYLQAWPQGDLSRISFPIEQRAASAYVFCLLAEQDPGRVNPQDLEQWRFWVVPTRSLHPERQSIGLQALIRAHGEGLRYEDLAGRIGELNGTEI